MNRTLYTLPVKGASALSIPCTNPTRRVEIIEDGGAPAQGIVLFYKKDNFTQGFTTLDIHQPVILGNPVSTGGGRGPILGLPAQVVQTDGGPVTTAPATVLFKATSATSTATKIIVTEYD